MFTRIVLLVLMLATSGCNQQTEEPIDLGVADGCNAAQESCTLQGRNIELSLSLGPTVKPLQPFELELAISGVKTQPDSVVADFTMPDMDMGENRYRLSVREGGRWQGRVILPICSGSRMDWLAIIEFTLEGRLYRARFPFQAEAS